MLAHPKTWPTSQEVFPLPIMGAPSASNSESALSGQRAGTSAPRALRAGWIKVGQDLFLTCDMALRSYFDK